MTEKKKVQIWDKIFKLIARKYPEEILAFVLGENKEYFSHFDLDVSQKENIAIEWTIDDVDYIAWHKHQKYIINIEAFDDYDHNIAREVFLHNAFLTRYHKAQVLSIGLVLDDTVGYKEEIYKVQSGKLCCQFSFPLIGLKDKEKIFEHHALLPFLLKIDKENYTEKVFQVIQEDETLRLLSVIILTRKGIPLEEALKKMQLNKNHFYKELMEFPAIEEFVNDMLTQTREEERKAREEERKGREEERKAREEERKGREEAEKKIIEERKAREEERKAREEAEKKAQEEQKETIALTLELKFGSKALFLLEKIRKIKDSEELTLLKQAIRMAKEVEEIQKYLETLKF